MKCKESKLSREYFDGIRQYKKRFFESSHHDDLYANPYVRPEVADSWIRSKNMGINPHDQILGKCINPADFSSTLAVNQLIIDIVKPLFANLVLCSGFGIYLFDYKGTFLYHEGEFPTLPAHIDPFSGLIWNETCVGTTSHSLSVDLMQPVQLVGPEHYSEVIEDIIASAAPIFGEHGGVIATIVLVLSISNTHLDENFQNLCTLTLGLITALAASVNTQLKLKRISNNHEVLNSQIQLANKTVEATLSLIDEGIVTINRNGMIIYCNNKARQIFNLEQNDKSKRMINEFMELESQLMALSEKGIPASIEETLGQTNQHYLIDIRPVMNEITNELDIAVLKIYPVDKDNAIVNKRSDAIANFSFENIIGDSIAVKKTIEKAKRYSKSSENILLTGESGTGKELFAQAIHNLSCPGGPFIALNCAALPRELIESELFGYEGGSFTGADRTGRPGKIELAEGGTLFLDEIGDMPIELQAVLLRVLEDKRVMRIGGRRYKKINFHLIAATNKVLFKLVKERLFREDLFYRLSILNITVPPLRQRESDILILAHYFLNRCCKKIDIKVPQLSKATLNILNQYEWPGNVRELQNVITYAVNNFEGSTIEPKDLSEVILCKGGFEQLDETITKADKGVTLNGLHDLNDMELNIINATLAETNWNVSRTASLLGISKSTIYRKLKKGVVS